MVFLLLFSLQINSLKLQFTTSVEKVFYGDTYNKKINKLKKRKQRKIQNKFLDVKHCIIPSNLQQFYLNISFF